MFKRLICVCLAVILALLLYNNVIQEQYVKSKYHNCDIVSVRNYYGGSNRSHENNTGWSYREYTLYDNIWDVTFIETYKRYLIFPYYHIDTGAPKWEDKVTYKWQASEYKDAMLAILSDAGIDAFGICDSSQDCGTEFSYLFVAYADNAKDALSKLAEYVYSCDYYVKFRVLVINDLNFYTIVRSQRIEDADKYIKYLSEDASYINLDI